MFDWIKNAIGVITGTVDKLVVDRDLKKKLNFELENAMMKFALDSEKELTKRHELDMKSDSWLSKNVRPMMLIFLTAMFVIITIFDGNIGQFEINPDYIPVYQALLNVVFMFYFGGRSGEKIMKIYKQRTNGDNDE